MQSTYKYRFDHSTIYWTLIYIIVFVLLGGLLYHLYEGGYLSAWFTSFIVALVALMSLSIPRKIVVSDETVEVRCLLDITEIRRDEIASVRPGGPQTYEMVSADLRRMRVLRLLRTLHRPAEAGPRAALRLGVAEFRRDHGHLRRPTLCLVRRCRPAGGRTHSAGRKPPDEDAEEEA